MSGIGRSGHMLKSAPLTTDLDSAPPRLLGICLCAPPPPPTTPTSLPATPCCYILSHGLYPPVSAPMSGPRPSCPPRTLHQDQKKNYKAVQSCEEGGSGGAYLEPLVALAQNGANMHNVLGPACIFLRKGFAESRQAVRKSRECTRMLAKRCARAQ